MDPDQVENTFIAQILSAIIDGMRSDRPNEVTISSDLYSEEIVFICLDAWKVRGCAADCLLLLLGSYFCVYCIACLTFLLNTLSGAIGRCSGTE
jgi:hypothetical protein